MKALSSATDDKHVPIAPVNMDDLNLETPLSSSNTTPEKVHNYMKT